MSAHRVLVVDDNQGFRDQVISAIAAVGIETHGAARGSEALRLCASLLPELVIVDLVRPASEGRWLIDRLMRRSDETPLGPPPQALLGLVPIGGDFSDLPDGVDLQVKPMFASQVVTLAQRLLVQLPGASITQAPTRSGVASGLTPEVTASRTAPVPPPQMTISRLETLPPQRPRNPSRTSDEEVPIAVEHVEPPRGYRDRDGFEEESSDFDPGQTLLAPVSMQDLARSMSQSTDDMLAVTVARGRVAPGAAVLAGAPSDAARSAEDIEILDGDAADAESADTHPRFDVDLRLNPMGTAASALTQGARPSGDDSSLTLHAPPSEPLATLSGDLGSIALVDIAALLARQGQTGLLRIESPGKQQQIDWVLRRGRLEQATAFGFAGLRLGHFILEQDILRQPEIDAVAAHAVGSTARGERDATQVVDPAGPAGPAALLASAAQGAVAQRPHDELLGVRLMHAGLLKIDDLRQALARQSAELMIESLRMPRGRFRFVRTTDLPPAAIDPDLGGGLQLDIEVLLLESARRQDAWHQVDRDAAEGAVYVSQVKSADEVRQLGLAPAEAAVLVLCTGRTGLADIARESRLPLAEVQKALQRLQSLGLCRRRLPGVLAS